MSQIRFSLAERAPGSIKSTGDSVEKIAVEDQEQVQAILDTIHNTKLEDHKGPTDW